MATGFNEEFDSEKDRLKKLKSSSETPVLDNFSVDLMALARKKGIDPIYGREEEIKRVTQILSRRNKNNPILIGEPGVGKSALVQGIANKIVSEGTPRPLVNKRILSLDLTSIVAGTKYRGQFEERMKAIIDEVRGRTDIILFIDEIHTIIGTGNSNGGLDVSNILKPSLARGEIQVIGATTLDEYRKHIEKDGALTRRFQKVYLEVPGIEETKEILKNVRSRYEEFHRVSYSDEAIDHCVNLADKYFTDRAFPDKALDVIDEVGAATILGVKPSPKVIKLEEKVAKLTKEKLSFVEDQKFQEAAIAKDKELAATNELQEEKIKWEKELKNNVTKISKDDINLVVSRMTGIPITRLGADENSKLMSLEEDLNNMVIGQEEAISKISKAIRRRRTGVGDETKPNSFLFIGNTGTGKTYLTKKMAEHLFGSESKLIRVDMSELMEKHSVSKLIGAPAGYVGHEDGGELTNKVRNNPYSIVLFDEIEKANPEIFNVLLQVLDEGHLTDSLGRKIDFKNTIIILTSNVGTRKYQDFGEGIGFSTTSDGSNYASTISKELKNKFPPEFINRLNDIIIFNDLTQKEIANIVRTEIDILVDRLKKKFNMGITYNKNLVEFITDNGFDKKFGARPLKRFISEKIEDLISDEMLSGNISEGSNFSINYTKTNGVQLKIK